MPPAVRPSWRPRWRKNASTRSRAMARRRLPESGSKKYVSAAPRPATVSSFLIRSPLVVSMAFESDYPDFSEANVIRRAGRREGCNRVRDAARSRPDRPPDGPRPQRDDALLGPYEHVARDRRRRGDPDPRGVRRAPARLAVEG